MKQIEVQKTNTTTLKSEGLKKKKSTQSTLERSIWTICPQAKDNKFSKQILNSNDMHVEAFKWKCTDDCKLFCNKSKTKQDGLMDGKRHS